MNASRIQIFHDFLERKNKKRMICSSIDVTLKTEKWCQKMQFEMLFSMVPYTNDNTSKSISLSRNYLMLLDGAKSRVRQLQSCSVFDLKVDHKSIFLNF